MNKYWLLLYLTTWAIPVSSQGEDNWDLLPSAIPQEHQRYAETGSASLTGTASVHLPGDLSSRCSPLDTVQLVPDTPYFRMLLTILISGHEPQPRSADEQLFVNRIIRSTTCNMNSQFHFEGLPALPYMVVTHLVVILGTIEKDVLQHVVLQPRQNLQVKLSEADIIRPGLIETGPFPGTRRDSVPVGDCETIAINLDLLQTEMAEWRDKNAEISNLQAYWFREGSRLYESIVPNLVQSWVISLIDKGFEGVAELYTEAARNDVRRMLTAIEAELVHSSGGRPLPHLTKSRLRQLLWPYITQGAVIQYARIVMKTSNILGYSAEAYELLEEEIIPFIHLLEASSIMENLEDIQKQMATWQSSILQRRQELTAAARQSCR